MSDAQTNPADFPTRFMQSLRYVLQKHEREMIARAELAAREEELKELGNEQALIDQHAKIDRARVKLHTANLNLDGAIGEFEHLLSTTFAPRLESGDVTRPIDHIVVERRGGDPSELTTEKLNEEITGPSREIVGDPRPSLEQFNESRSAVDASGAHIPQSGEVGTVIETPKASSLSRDDITFLFNVAAYLNDQNPLTQQQVKQYAGRLFSLAVRENEL